MQLLQEPKLHKIGKRRMRQRLGQLPRCPALTPDGLSGTQLRLFGAGSLPGTGAGPGLPEAQPWFPT